MTPSPSAWVFMRRGMLEYRPDCRRVALSLALTQIVQFHRERDCGIPQLDILSLEFGQSIGVCSIASAICGARKHHDIFGYRPHLKIDLSFFDPRYGLASNRLTPKCVMLNFLNSVGKVQITA